MVRTTYQVVLTSFILRAGGAIRFLAPRERGWPISQCLEGSRLPYFFGLASAAFSLSWRLVWISAFGGMLVMSIHEHFTSSDPTLKVIDPADGPGITPATKIHTNP